MSDHPAAEFIARRADQPDVVEVEGNEVEAYFFDWFTIDDRQRADFETYFAGERAGVIANGTWLPIAVLGLGFSPASFADTRGFLALVVDDGTVRHYRAGDAETQVASSIDDLDTQLDVELDTD